MGVMAMEMSFVSEERFTQETFRRWLDGLPDSASGHYELIGGCVVVSPPARAWHGSVESRVSGIIGHHVDARGLGRIFGSSAGLELPTGETLQPDVSFVSRQQWEAGPRPGSKDFLRIVPSLVVEILSPSTARRDRTVKLEIYARNGVEEYWIIDPLRRELTVFCREGATFAPAAARGEGAISSRVLPDLGARVEDLFVDLD